MTESWLIGTWNCKWRTRDGDEIAVKDLTDDHLCNIIAFLEPLEEDTGFLDANDEWQVGDNCINGRSVEDWKEILRYEQLRRASCCNH